MTFFYIAAGVAILIFGRKLFWLFVGIIGFLLGMTLAQQVLPNLSETIHLVIAIGIGFLGAILTSLVKKVAVGLAGFLAGAYLASVLLPMVGFSLGSLTWIAIGVGGILGALLASSMFDWALILLSSGVGASMITDVLDLPKTLAIVLFLALAIVGIIIQGNIKSRD